MHDTITYDIFKDDSAGSPVWLEAVQGLGQAMNRMEELAANDPSTDYFLFCAQAGKVVRRLRRRSASSYITPDSSHKKAS